MVCTGPGKAWAKVKQPGNGWMEVKAASGGLNLPSRPAALVQQGADTNEVLPLLLRKGLKHLS